MKHKLQLLGIAFLASLAVHCKAGPADVTLAWNPPPAPPVITNFTVMVGTTSGNYTTNWNVTGTNTVITPAQLSPGWNYIAVCSRMIVNDTNAVLAVPSNEVQIHLSQGSGLKVR